MPFVESQVNTFTANSQYSTVTTQLPGGGWVITWASTLEDGSGSGVQVNVQPVSVAMACVDRGLAGDLPVFYLGQSIGRQCLSADRGRLLQEPIAVGCLFDAHIP